MDQLSFYGRCLLLVFLAWWSWRLFAYDYRSGEINGSFMHNILLAIHEAGHVIFIPCGEFMTILGGSLFQLLLPLGWAACFVLRQRDNFAAAVTLWWAGQSFVDLSPYIHDAPYRLLPLVGGGGEESHDWGNPLTPLDALGRSPTPARASVTSGALLMALAPGWAARPPLRARARCRGGPRAPAPRRYSRGGES